MAVCPLPFAVCRLPFAICHLPFAICHCEPCYASHRLTMGVGTILALFRKISFALRARQHAADLADELESHRARIQADLERDGIPPAEAAVRSRRAMGNITLAREDARDVWTVALVDRTWRDVKYAVRGLRREPLFAASACLTLALGLTLVTTVFSVVDGELWKPLPFARPQQLVAVYPRSPGAHGTTEKIAGADLLDWRAQNHAFSALAGVANTTRAVLQRDSARSVLVTSVTANYFDLLGEPAFIGRLLAPGDDLQRSTAVLSERAWRRLFGGAPSGLGRTVTIDDRPLVIVAVPSGTREFAADPTDIFVALDEHAADFLDRSRRAVDVIGRLRDRVTARVAEQEMQ